MCVNERRSHVKLGVTKDGLITGVDESSLIDHGTPGSSEMTVYDRDWTGYYTLKCEKQCSALYCRGLQPGLHAYLRSVCALRLDMITIGFT
jgi:hypothetical protein